MIANKQKKPDKRLITLSLLAIVLFIAFILFSPNGILRYYSLKKNLQTLQAANAELHQQNQELLAEIDRLKNDPEYLEEIARKRFGLIKKNELIFNFRSQKNKR